MEIKLNKLIAPNFYDLHHDIKNDTHDEFWIKGGRGSTKSTFISIQIILGLIADPESNAVICRRYQNELRDTVYGQMSWTINRMGIDHLFKFQVSPMQIIYIPTGQRIVFKGADNPRKLKSINLGKGYIKYAWFEELDQFAGMEEIRNIIQSLFRGDEEEKRVSFYSYNPPKSGRSWVNQEAKVEKDGRRVHTSDYREVPQEWLGEAFIANALHLEKVNELAYRHEYLGEEVGTGLEVFNNVEIRAVTNEEMKVFDKLRQGLDFGYAANPLCFNRMHFDSTRRRVYMFDEISGINIGNRQFYSKTRFIHRNVLTIADSAEPKSIAELKDAGMKIKGARKGPGSVEFGVKSLQELEKIVIDPSKCPLAAKEFVNYALDTMKDGTIKERFPDKENHCLTADTIINTDTGDIPIVELVGKSGIVNCFDIDNEKPVKSEYFDVRKTISDAKVFEIELEDGRNIKATSMHPVLTSDGWYPLSELKEGDMILDIAKHT